MINTKAKIEGNGDISKHVPDWKKLEQLVAAIQAELAPGAKVSHNVMLPGRDSGVPRQIDVLVEQHVGQYKVRIIIDCKDYKTPVDVNGVGAFHSMMVDVGAHQGALVCPAGFTDAAKNAAQRHNIGLYRPLDTEAVKWKATVSAPVICDFRSAAMAFGISVSAPVPFKISTHPAEFQVFDTAEKPLGSFLEIASRRWDEGKYPTEAGQHRRVPLLGEQSILMDNGYEQLVPVDLYLSIHVTKQLYFGHVPIPNIRGLVDEHTGEVITNAFTVGGFNPGEITENWLRIDSEDDAPSKTMMKVTGLHCWSVK